MLTRKWFRCPSCQHDFPLRVKHKRDIKCPKCRSAFQQGLALLSGDDAINARREHLARRQSRLIERRVRIAKSERRSIANHVPQSPLSVIRGDQVPVSLSELEFKLRATEKGWRVHRPSWPDFLVETPDGECFAVEVKVSDRLGARHTVCHIQPPGENGCPVLHLEECQGYEGILGSVGKRARERSRSLKIGFAQLLTSYIIPVVVNRRTMPCYSDIEYGESPDMIGTGEHPSEYRQTRRAPCTLRFGTKRPTKPHTPDAPAQTR